MTIRKIKIKDDDELRAQIDSLHERMSQIVLAKWSIKIARHIIETVGIDENKYPEIREGFAVNEMWQAENARMHDVRQAGLKIHKLAREQIDEITKCAFRVIGHAVACGHMKEHAMVASDYAVKVITILYKNDLAKVQEERNFQLTELQNLFALQITVCR